MISPDKIHEKWMKYALAEAVRAYDNDEVESAEDFLRNFAKNK